MNEGKVERRSMVGVPPTRRPRNSTNSTPAATPTRVSSRSVKRTKRDEQEEFDFSDNEKPSDDSGDEDVVEEELSLSSKKSRKRKRAPLTDYHLKKKKILARKAQREAEKKALSDEEKSSDPEPENEKKETAPETVRKPPSLSKYSSLQLMMDHILRKIIAKDPEQYFAFPVTADIAPDYNKIIQIPMDFQTIREKIEDNKYESVPELRKDFELIVQNALQYNQSNTVFYLAALRLEALIRYYFSEQYLRYIFHTLPFANKIPFDKAGITPLGRLRENFENKRRLALVDDMTADQCLDNADEKVRDKLSTRKPKAKLAFLNERDGTMVLNVIGETPATEEKVVTIGDIVGNLEEGTPGLIQLGEHRLHSQTTVNYLNYGAFASFAPQYDSTWATMSKDDTDLLLRTYGDRGNASDAMSLRNFVLDSGEHMIKVVDDLLDTLTDGEHSRSMKELGLIKETTENDNKINELDGLDIPTARLIDDVASLANLGIDVGFLDDLRKDLKKPEKVDIQQSLNQTGQAIQDLALLQQQRLQQPPPTSLSVVPEPSATEQKLAEQVQQQLVQQVVQHSVPPSEFVSAPTLHDAMGMDGDDDLFKEFFVTQ